MKYYIVSSLISENSKSILKKHGELIEILSHPTLPSPEKHHSDMQFAKINDTLAIYAQNIHLSNKDILSNFNTFKGNTILKEKYPDNIAYNILRCGNDYFHNTKYTDTVIKDILTKNKCTLHHIRQGYSGCSSISIPLQNNYFLVLSSDKGIIKFINNLHKENIFTQYFEETKNIILPGYDHGFIGGCCGYDNELGLLVYGKINGQLQELSAKYKFKIFSINDSALTDIGGISVMYSSR